MEIYTICLKWNEYIFVRFLSHISFSTWKYRNWRSPWRIAVYSLNAGYIPVGIYLCPFKCFPRWFPLASCIVLYVRSAHAHAYAYISIYVWFSICGFCQVKCNYSHTFSHVALVIASTAGSCSCICSAATPDLSGGTLGETGRLVPASAHPAVSFTI